MVDLRDPQQKAALEISVDSDFVLFVNGREAGRGQFSDYPQEKTYSRFDVGGNLRKGNNCIAILAYHRGENFSDHRAGKPGLILALATEEETLFSDPTWKCVQHPAFTSGDMPKVTSQQGFTSCFDARKDLAWTDLDFDDAGWADAAVQAHATSGFWSEIRPRPVPLLIQEKAVEVKVFCHGNFIRRKECRTYAETMAHDALVAMPGNAVFASENAPAGSEWWTDIALQADAASGLLLNPPEQGFDGAFFIIDFKREFAGLIHFDLEAPEGTVLDIGHGEHVLDGRLRVRLGLRNFADRYVCRAGRNRYTLPFRRIGGRYLEVHISNYSAPLKISYFGLIPLSLPGLTTRAFRTSDTLAEKIHETSVRTLECCMHEHYEDTPWREQSLYAFDGRNQALYGYFVFGNYDFAAASFDLLGRGIRDDGLLELCAPAKINPTIPMFSLVWITALAEHWQYSGSPVLFDTFSGQIAQMLAMVFARKDPDSGLYRAPDAPGMWHFYEWVPELSTGSDAGQRLDAPYNLFLHEALGACSRMLRMSGKIWEADAIDGKRHELGHAISKTFWNDQNQCLSSFVLDGKHSGFHQLVQCLALHENILTDQRKRITLRKISSPNFHKMTLSSMLYLVRTLMDGNEESRRMVSSLIREDWGKMVLSGASTCWETIKGETDFDGSGSLCHGWSALPVYYYHAYVLGIRPLTPGFKTFSVAPYCDHFHYAKGEVMTPHGPISSEWTRKDGGIELTVSCAAECHPVLSAYSECQIARAVCNGVNLLI